MVNVVGETKDGPKTAPAGLAVSYSPEYRKLGGDEFTLARLDALSQPLVFTGADLFGKGRKPQVEHTSAWELLVLLALYLWLLDVAVRRVSWSREYLEMAEEAWLSYMAKVRAERIRSGRLKENISVGRLLARSRDVRDRLGVERAARNSAGSGSGGADLTYESSGQGDARTGPERTATGRIQPERMEQGVVWHKTVEASAEERSASYIVKAKQKVKMENERTEEPEETNE